ncbi:MAG TPA: AraC family transcriptional regulator [Tepidisphaeraceae bacterium]|nr:AraC family transcriptional regulator [Tepidisphaeraceae bacterium]
MSTLPRGSVNIVQPARTAESLLKSYTREFHREDRLAWQAIFRGQTVRSSDVWTQTEFQNSPYLHGFLQPHGLRFAMAAPLANPVLNGYPGAALLMRGPDEGDFSDAEVGKLKNIGREMDEFTSKSRPNRNAEIQMNTDPWTHSAPTRMFIFNKDAKAIFPKGKLNIDERVEQQLLQHVKQAAENAKRGQLYSDRLLLPDSRGDIWVFHGIVHRDFPAFGPGPAIFFMLQPESNEWVSVRPNEVAADNEMVRLLPTLKFMQQEFHKNPTLDDIARKAHLSPFHFHRRFTDLIGQTPKHFLLGCQIHAAKRGLASRRRELAQIASDTGFAHQSHFTSRFKQATGLTPTRWRRLAAEIVRGQK